MRYREDDESLMGRFKNFLLETPLASMLLKLLELFTVSMGFSFVLTFIIGSGLAKIIYYRPTEVTYTTLFLSVFGFFSLGAIFLRGFRGFCHSVKEYLVIMLSAYGIFLVTSYWGLGFKFLPISSNVLELLPSWLYHGWNNQTFENIFLPLRIFAYYQWMPDWASLTVVHILYISMIVFFAYNGGEFFEVIKSAITNIEFKQTDNPYSAKAKAKYEKRRRRIIRANKGSLDDADVDYDAQEYDEYLKDAFGDEVEEIVPVTIPDLSTEDEEGDDVSPDYDSEYDEYMKDAFDSSFDEEFPYENMEYEQYSQEYDEYMKDAFDEDPDTMDGASDMMDPDDDEDFEEYDKEFDEYLKDAFDDDEEF